MQRFSKLLWHGFYDASFNGLMYRCGRNASVNEEPKPRLPDSIARPITNMPLSRMKNTTFVKPSIIDFHDMGLRTVLTVRTPKEQRLFNAIKMYHQ
ncbi:hypothetical protein TNCV_3137701 [Trichonephila clavipes]|nr:hypothetical protein TNCV_3137701 [Trichonephila clavipes]